MTIFLHFYTTRPFQEGSALKGKNLLPLGADSFLFRADPFLEGKKKHILTELPPLKVYLVPLRFLNC